MKLPFPEKVVSISHHSQIVKLYSLILDILTCKYLKEWKVVFIYKEKKILLCKLKILYEYINSTQYFKYSSYAAWYFKDISIF